eukprot:8655103-Pyramimonas_sp.AAC.1
MIGQTLHTAIVFIMTDAKDGMGLTKIDGQRKNAGASSMRTWTSATRAYGGARVAVDHLAGSHRPR